MVTQNYMTCRTTLHKPSDEFSTRAVVMQGNTITPNVFTAYLDGVFGKRVWKIIQ